MQQRFSILTLVMALLMAASILAAHDFFAGLPDRKPLDPAVAELRLEPVSFDEAAFAPLRLVAAWKVTSADPRVGAVSALAIDEGDLVAVTDTGAVIRFPRPTASRLRAQVRDLPAVPADPRYKMNRDSEAVVADPGGRGWWVAFENRNSLWLYDAAFERPLRRIGIPEAGLDWNVGIEGLVTSGAQLLLLPERGGRALRLGESGWATVPFAFPRRRISGAAALSDESLLVIERRLTLLGFENALVRLDRCPSGYCRAWRKPLPVGRFDNLEAIAIEPLASGAKRLWLMTDDNENRSLRTLLLAADLPPELQAAAASARSPL